MVLDIQGIGNVLCDPEIATEDIIDIDDEFAFAAISKFRFSRFSRHTIYKLIIAVTALLIAFLIKINTKKLNQIICKLSTANISLAALFCFAHVEHF